MRTHTKLVVLLVTILLVLPLGFACAPKAAPPPPTTPTPAPVVITWKAIGAWDKTLIYMKPYFDFIDELNNRAKGQLVIKYIGGPEAWPTMKQLEPIRDGTFDMLYTSYAYHTGIVPEGQCLDLIRGAPSERRATGAFELLDKIYQEKAGVKFAGDVGSGTPYNLMMKKQIAAADLRGMKISTTPFYDPLVRGLGGSPVQLTRAERYTALQTGVADGVTSSMLGAVGDKWYEVLKYVVFPSFGEVTLPILVNTKSWNQLPRPLQELFTKTALDTETKSRQELSALYEPELKELIRLGMERIDLPPAEAKKFLNIFWEKSWEELIIKPSPTYGPQLKKMLEPLGAYAK